MLSRQCCVKVVCELNPGNGTRTVSLLISLNRIGNTVIGTDTCALPVNVTGLFSEVGSGSLILFTKNYKEKDGVVYKTVLR